MTFQIMVYENFSSDKPEHGFVAKNGRQAVGLLKTIFDNFHPVHIDIVFQEAFNTFENSISGEREGVVDTPVNRESAVGGVASSCPKNLLKKCVEEIL